MILFRLSQIFLLVLPFQMALNPVEGIDLPFARVFAVILFFFWLARELSNRRFFIPIRQETFFLLSFLFVAVASFLWAENPARALRRATFLLSFIPLFLVFSSIVLEFGAEGRKGLVSAFVTGSAGVALVGIGEFFLQFFIGVGPAFHLWVERVLPIFLGSSFAEAVLAFPSLLVNIAGTTVLRASAFFPDPHMFAFYMGLSIPLSFALGVLAPTGGKRKLFFSLALLLFLADLLSFSRGGYVGLLAGLLLTFILFLPSVDWKRKFIILAVTASVVFGAFFLDTPFRDRLLSSFSLSEGSNKGRLVLWEEGIGNIARQPFFGYGLGNYPLVVNPTATSREPIYIHNLPLDIASETGLVGMAFFLLAFFWILIRLFRSTDALSRSVAVALVVFLGHALFENPLYSVHVLPALMLLFSLPRYER